MKPTTARALPLYAALTDLRDDLLADAELPAPAGYAIPRRPLRRVPDNGWMVAALSLTVALAVLILIVRLAPQSAPPGPAGRPPVGSTEQETPGDVNTTPDDTGIDETGTTPGMPDEIPFPDYPRTTFTISVPETFAYGGTSLTITYHGTTPGCMIYNIGSPHLEKISGEPDAEPVDFFKPEPLVMILPPSPDEVAEGTFTYHFNYPLSLSEGTYRISVRIMGEEVAYTTFYVCMPLDE